MLAVRPNETVVDGTFGAGGHAAILAEGLRGNGKLIAVDRDPSVRPYFERFRRRAGVQARLLRGDFSVVLRQLRPVHTRLLTARRMHYTRHTRRQVR